MACKEQAPRSRRPHACGDVFCAEPGRFHSRPALVPGRLGKAKSRTPGMYVDEKSDEVIVPGEAAEQRKVTSGGGRGGKGLTQGKQPSDGQGSDTEPSRPVYPIGGCALDCKRVQTACLLTFDRREEPGALAAHAGICAGGEE
jgi:hypothetical protein